MNNIQNLLSLNIHLGRKTNEWHPQMLPYIYSEQNGNYILNVFQTQKLLNKARKFLNLLLRRKKSILFIGTKKSAFSVVEKTASFINQYFVNSYWLPGLLTNWKTTKQKIKTLNMLESEMNNGSFAVLPKKERLIKEKKLVLLHKYLKGIRYMEKLPTAIVIIDPFVERIAFEEAKKLNIKIIALHDINISPEFIHYPIPTNSDSFQSTQYILEELVK